LGFSDFLNPLVHIFSSPWPLVVEGGAIYEELDCRKASDLKPFTDSGKSSGIDFSHNHIIIFQELSQVMILRNHGLAVGTPGGIKLDNHILVIGDG
jgi:hypothetical protein